MVFSKNSLVIKIPLFCLFVSGAASLTYELVWIKRLSLIFGGTLYAISAVLCAFMTGLALGAWAVALYLDRAEQKPGGINHIRLYGILEGLIGVYALLFPSGLKLLETIYPALNDLGFGSHPSIHFIEFILSAVLMFPATLLMGATLPIIGSWAIQGQSANIFRNVSVLYSLNTFGAVAGCLFTQFLAIKYFGLQGTTLAAVGMNGLIFVLCFPFKKIPITEEKKAPPKPENREIFETEPTRFLKVFLLVIFSFSGMVALANEILWTRILVFPLGSSLYSFALILATFLFGIALGSLFADKLIGGSIGKNRPRWIEKFLLVELAIGVYCIGIIPAFETLPELTAWADKLFYGLENTPSKTLMVRSMFAFGLMFLPTLGFGMIFPLANHINFSLFQGVTRTLGNSYAVNTLGAIMGAILTPFLFIPFFGIRSSLFLLSAALIFLSCLALTATLGWTRLRLGISLGILILMLFGAYSFSNPGINTNRMGDHNFARMEINVPQEQTKLLDYKEGNFSTLSVVENIRTGARTLYVDGFSTATVSNSVGGSAYMQAMGFLPMALHPNPRRALVMCFGTGNTLGTVSLFPGVEVDGVEIDRNVLSLAHWFTKWNHDVLKKSNIQITVQDARNFIQWTPNRYDVITLEPMSPVQAGVANLYSREFYQNSRDRLTPDGIMMQWLPLHLVGPAESRAIIKTFQAAFPYTSVWNSFLTRIVLLVGSNSEIKLDKKRFEKIMLNPDLKKAAQQIGIHSFTDIMDFFLADGKDITGMIGETHEITDDFPLLEYSPVNLLPPLKRETDEMFLNLLRHRVNGFPPVKGLASEDTAYYSRDFELRTAQRMSVFSQRYQGPGREAFARKQFLSGLEQVKVFLDGRENKNIRLSESGWE